MNGEQKLQGVRLEFDVGTGTDSDNGLLFIWSIYTCLYFYLVLLFSIKVDEERKTWKSIPLYFAETAVNQLSFCMLYFEHMSCLTTVVSSKMFRQLKQRNTFA